jgi:Fe2+ transport system protein B
MSKLESLEISNTGDLFPKRRSESASYNQQNEKHNQYHRTKSKNDIKSEKEDIEVKNKRKLGTLSITAKAKVTAKADEVKALEKTLKEFRVEKERQVDKKIEAESPATLPPHLANTSISILTFIIFIFTFNIFISIFNPFVADPPDHHFQTFTSGNVSDCKVPCLSLRTISAQMKPIVNALANSDSTRLFKIPETPPDARSRNLHRNRLVPKHLLSGRARKSESDLYHDPFIFHYLDSSR